MHKNEFGQDYCNYLFTRIIEEFISYFLCFISFSMHFRILNEFLEFINENQNPGKGNGMISAWPEFGPWPRYAGPAHWLKHPERPMPLDMARRELRAVTAPTA
jgi:hypothetical protein